MFGWRRRGEGFEWREYVRTTVLIRRADRQRRIEDARLQAIDAVKAQRDRGLDAGRERLESAVSATSGAAHRVAAAVASFIKRSLRVCTEAARRSAATTIGAARVIPFPGLGPVLDPVRRALRHGVAFARNMAGLISDLPHISPIGKKHIAYAICGLGLIYGIGPMLRGDVPTAPGTIRIANLVPVSSEAPGAMSGRALAISGDTLRVNGILVKLKGIEAPGPAYPCLKANGRRWQCGPAATTALNRLVRGKIVTCEPHSTSTAGQIVAGCRSGDMDFAAELVRSGKVFAEGGAFATYGSEEQAAREAHTGIWQGDTLRPETWREQIWEEAKKSAPDGCPIKGFVRASARLYAMPWSNGYGRARIRESRGERWFCNEEDARAAGFTLADSS